jgi:nucleoside phosphorylase
MPTTLLVGALLPEVLPLIRLLEQPRPINHRLFQGKINNHTILILRCGVGITAAHHHTEKTLQLYPVDRIISIGTCGALSNHLQIGDVCTTAKLITEDGEDIAVQPLHGFPTQRLICVQRFIGSPERRELYSAIADICEMEAFGVWMAANALQATTPVPFHCLKVISDHAGKVQDPVLDDAKPKSFQVAQFMLRAGYLSHHFLQPSIKKIHS